MPPNLNQKWLAVLRAFPSLLSPPAEPNERLPADPFALVSAGRLTRFQYDLLSSGQGKELILGNYVLVDQIGEGGMGVVYKARHAKLGRTVAVKVIRAERLKTKTAVRRFVREVRASAKLDHPLIVRALDADSVDGRHFLAMEYVDGCDLATELERGPFSIADALAVAFQVALALQHLYENGVVHRDLKPTNLIRDRKTQAVKVLDLGLSRIINPEPGAESAALTQAGTIIGTPDYMAPEQGQDVRVADTRSDLYSLGCTLYFLLTGRVPFPGGTTIEKILRHCQDKPTPVTAFRSDIPPEVAAVVDRLMAREPDDRFQTPAELISALTVLGTMPVSPGGRATGATGSNPNLLGPASTPPSDAALVPTVAMTTGDSSWRVALAEVIARDSTLSGRHPVPEARPAVRLKEYRSTAVAVGGLLAAVLLLAVAIVPWGRVFPSPAPPTEPGDEPRALRDRIAKWLEMKDPAAAPALRADAQAALRKATGTADAVTIAKYLKQLPSPLDKLPDPPGFQAIGTVRQRAFGPVNHLAVSADGKTLVFGGWDRSVQVWDAEGMTPKSQVNLHLTTINRVAVSADGKRVAGVSGFQDRDRDDGFERTLYAVDFAKDQTLKIENTPTGGGWCLSAAFTPDNHVFAGQYEEASLWTLGAKGHRPTRKFYAEGMNWCSAAAVSADGKTAFTGGNAVNWQVHDHALVWDLSASPPPPDKNGYPTPEKPAQRLAGHHGPVLAMAPHPDNQRVLTVDHEAARVFDYRTGKLLKEVRTQGVYTGGCWSPDGKQIVLATGAGRVLWLDPVSGTELRAGTGHLGRVSAVAASGTHVFSSGDDGTVRKWDSATGKEVQPVTPGYPVARIAFADEDRKLVVLPARGTPTAAAPTDPDLAPAANGSLADAEALALVPDGTKALLRSPDNGRATLWDFSTATATACDVWPESADAKAAAFGPDGKRVWYAVSKDKDPSGTLRWTDLETGETVKFALPPEVGGEDTKAHREKRIAAREVTAVAVSPDGKVGVAATRSREVFGWEFATNKLVLRHKDEADHPGAVRQLVFGPVGRRVFGVGLGSDVWITPLGSTRTDEFFHTAPNTPRCVAVSADDDLIAVGSWDGEVALYSVGGAWKRTIKAPGPVTAVAFSSDGRGLAAGLANGTVAVYKILGP